MGGDSIEAETEKILNPATLPFNAWSTVDWDCNEFIIKNTSNGKNFILDKFIL